MLGNEKPQDPQGSGKGLVPPRDLADFASRWKEFRPDAVEVAGSGALPERQAAVVRWLIELADKAGPRDLA